MRYSRSLLKEQVMTNKTLAEALEPTSAEMLEMANSLEGWTNDVGPIWRLSLSDK